jgi:hypothetical protein
VLTGLPLLSSTIRHPNCAVSDLPSVVGRLPTTTWPPGRMLSAYVSPTPPRQLPGKELARTFANSDCLPAWLICTIVSPVPWLLALSLKLLKQVACL